MDALQSLLSCHCGRITPTGSRYAMELLFSLFQFLRGEIESAIQKVLSGFRACIV